MRAMSTTMTNMRYAPVNPVSRPAAISKPGSSERTAGLPGDDQSERDAKAETGKCSEPIGDPGDRRMTWPAPRRSCRTHPDEGSAEVSWFAGTAQW